MQRPRIIIPVDPFDSPTLSDAAERRGLSLVVEMTGSSDMVEGESTKPPRVRGYDT